LNTPSVWRSARSQAAAKVGALASNGMDEIEIRRS
jgi:cell division protein FtsZ